MTGTTGRHPTGRHPTGRHPTGSNWTGRTPPAGGRRGAAGEAGSVTVELVVLAPLLILLALFVIGLGRLAEAKLVVDDAAHQAARAASLARTPEAARRQATSTAEAVLDGRRASCAVLTVTVDTAQLRPGGLVTARVTCQVALADLVGLGMPGQRPVTSTFTSPVDVHRGVGP